MSKRASLSAAIDALSDVMPNGALMVATDPVAFLLSARDELSALRARVAELLAALDLADCTQREGGDVRHCGDVRCWRCRAEAAERRVAELEARLQFDPGGSDKIDELDQAIQLLRHELDVERTELGLKRSDCVRLGMDCDALKSEKRAAEQRVAELGAALAAAESAYSEAIAGALDQRDAAEKRVAEMEAQLAESAGALDLLDLYEGRRVAAEQRVAELERECAQMSEEFGLPPTIRPAEGEIRRFMAELKESRARASAAEQRVERLEVELAGVCGAAELLLSQDSSAVDVERLRERVREARAALAASDSEANFAAWVDPIHVPGNCSCCGANGCEWCEANSSIAASDEGTEPKSGCHWCGGVDGGCGAVDAATKYECTRRPGHDGEHVACASNEKNPARCDVLARWSVEAPARDVECPRCYGHGETAWDDTRVVGCSECAGTGKAREGGR